MALHSKTIDYTVYPPNHRPGMPFWEFRTIAKARLAAKKLGVGARLRRNINVIGKSRTETDWWVERVWESAWKRICQHHQESKQRIAMILRMFVPPHVPLPPTP